MEPQQNSCNADPGVTPATKVGPVDAPAIADAVVLQLQRIDEYEEQGIPARDPYESLAAVILASSFRDAIVLERGIRRAMGRGRTAAERLVSAAPEINTLLRVSRAIAKYTALAIAIDSARDHHKY